MAGGELPSGDWKSKGREITERLCENYMDVQEADINETRPY